MKKNFFASMLAALLLSCLGADAQSRRYSRRYDDRYEYRRSYPSRTSISVVASLPFGAVAVSFGRRNYHYYEGYYYSPYERGYAIVEPPMGIIVPGLPQGSVAVMIGSRNYYRFQSVFYLPLGNNQYQVVEKPAETETATTTTTTAKTSPVEYEKITLEGKTYYRKGGKFYKASVDESGEISYQEVGETIK